MKIARGFIDLLKNLLVMTLSIFVAIVIAEVLSRFFLPIFPGSKLLSLDGRILEISSIQPGTVYRQFSQEYDALTTITEHGYRVPEVIDTPDIIFIGDSFTFGVGLNDEETFAYIFCRSLQLSCANLGVGGAGTITELDRLEEFLIRESWRPKYVFLFILAMTQFLGAGNDLYDNLEYADTSDSVTTVFNRDPASDKLAMWSFGKDFLFFLLDYRKLMLRYSNLIRGFKYYFAPQIKQYVSPPPEQNMLSAALAVTKEQLFRLEALSTKYHFDYHIFLLHPVQDILRNTHRDTFEILNSISPKIIHETSSLFGASAEQYYYSLDGHLNAKGSLIIANYLLSIYDRLIITQK